MPSITDSQSWKKLVEHQREMSRVHMRDLFAEDPDRFNKFSLKFKDILLDFSKNRITEQTFKLLLGLTREARLEKWIERMFGGEKINITEGRAVLHVALRNRSNRRIIVDGQDVMPEVNKVLGRMKRFCKAVREGEWRGFTGKRITDVVNIGIGGSEPRAGLVVRARQAQGRERETFLVLFFPNPAHAQLRAT